MKKIQPFLVEETNLVSSNVPILEEEWTPGTYATGIIKTVGSDVYEVVASPNTSDSPMDGSLLETPTWIRTGVINQLKMFDYITNSQTVNSGAIEVVFAFDKSATGLALFGSSVALLSVAIDHPFYGELYNKQFTLQDNEGINNIFSYLTAPIAYKSEFVLTDLPDISGCEVSITADNGPSSTIIGELVIGSTQFLGSTDTDLSFSLKDFSTVETNVFGDTTVVLRNSTKDVEYSFAILENNLSAVWRDLSSNSSLPAAYIGDEFLPETITFGIMTKLRINKTGSVINKAQMTVQGLV